MNFHQFSKVFGTSKTTLALPKTRYLFSSPFIGSEGVPPLSPYEETSFMDGPLWNRHYFDIKKTQKRWSIKTLFKEKILLIDKRLYSRPCRYFANLWQFFCGNRIVTSRLLGVHTNWTKQNILWLDSSLRNYWFRHLT